jgi:hypothetical protein
MNDSMMKLFVTAAIAMFALSVSAGAATDRPLRILSDTVCPGDGCAAVELYGSTVAPALTSQVSTGRLTVDGESPFASCLERLDRDKVPAVASCIERRLGSRRAGEMLAAQGHDLYMVLVLANDRGQAVQGEAVFLTAAGRTFVAPVILSPMEQQPDGAIQYTTIARARPDAPIVLGFHQLVERAAFAGIAGFPQHRPILEHSSPSGSGTYYGNAVVQLMEPVPAGSKADDR